MDDDIWGDRIGYADDEWTTWTHVAQRERDEARQFLYAKGNTEDVRWFEEFLSLAHDYHCSTGGHLNVYGEIGELFGAAAFGIRRHQMYAQGSDGRLGDDFVEINTITPFKGKDQVEVNLDSHFNKLLLVRIDPEFVISGRLLDRRVLRRQRGKRCIVRWNEVDTLGCDTSGPAEPEVWGGWDI